MKASVRPHPCPICMRLTTNKGKCDECYNRRKASGYIEAWSRNQQTTKIHQLYYTGRWKKIRSQVLSRDNYLCRECLKQGRATTATEVDHIVPTAKGGRMFDMENLQSLCHDCHLAKTKAEYMPNLFLKPCQYPGCRKYAVQGSAYCREHQTKVSNEFDKHRGTSRERGYTSKWETFRKTFLDEHPLCVECLKHGRIKPATDVDHIVPHKGDMNMFWNLKNLQALCHECHSRKTAIEDSNFLKTRRGSKKVHTQECNRPVSSLHTRAK